MTAPDLRAGPSGPLVGVGDFDNMIWVNPIAALGGDGSVLKPFRTPSEAVSSVPAGASATIILAPGDYSATLSISIANRDISFFCIGGARTGNKSIPARALLPPITFAVSTSLLTFYCSNCVITGTTTVLSAVEATLDNVSSTWADAGNLATVFATGYTSAFAGASQQTINGTIGAANLVGMLTQSLTCLSVILTRCQVVLGGTGVAANFIVVYDFDADPGAVSIIAATALFCDQWSLFQFLENGVNLGATPPINVQEASPETFWWGANGYTAGQFFPPYVHFAASNASSALEWIPAPRKCFGKVIFAQRSTAPAADQTFTLHKAATLAGVAATALVVTILTGQLSAKVELAVPVVINQGDFMVMKPSQTDAAGVVEIRVTAL